MFKLDERLEQDTIALASWPLCEVRLMNDRQFPWVILVPRVENIRELYELSGGQRMQLDAESTFLAKTLMTQFKGNKMNVAALGNVVSQLHIHHVVRFEHDPAWPAPIWGKLPLVPYREAELKVRMSELSAIIDKSWTNRSASTEA